MVARCITFYPFGGIDMALTRAQRAARQRWTAALRSGEYEQWWGSLRSDHAFCCLGVACDVVGAGLWDRDGCYMVIPGEVHEGCLPGQVGEALGLSSRDEARLVEMNDDDGATFDEIADTIDLLTLAGL